MYQVEQLKSPFWLGPLAKWKEDGKMMIIIAIIIIIIHQPKNLYEMASVKMDSDRNRWKN